MICGCIPTGPMGMHISGLPKYFLIRVSSMKGVSYLLQTFSLVSRIVDFWRTILPVQTEAKAVFTTSNFSASSLIKNGTTFSFLFPLSPTYSQKPFLVSFTSLVIFNWSWPFDLPKLSAACSESVSLFPARLPVLASTLCWYLFFLFESGQEFLDHPYRPPGIFCLVFETNSSWAWKWW